MMVYGLGPSRVPNAVCAKYPKLAHGGAREGHLRGGGSQCLPYIAKKKGPVRNFANCPNIFQGLNFASSVLILWWQHGQRYQCGLGLRGGTVIIILLILIIIIIIIISSSIIIIIIIIIGSSSWDIDVSSWVEFVPTATRTTLWVYEGTGNVTSVWTLAVCGRFLYWKDLRVSNKVTTRWEGPQSLLYHKYSLSKMG